MLIVYQKWGKNLVRLEGKIEAVFVKIKALIKGITLQHNGIQSQEVIRNDLVATGTMIGESL